MSYRGRARKVLGPKRKEIRYFDFPTLARINAEVVLLTGDKYEFTEEDEHTLKLLLTEVEERANDQARTESIIQKVSLLIFGIAQGQHFHEGNKRTALVAAEAFLKANGHTLDMKDKSLVHVVDESSIGQASLTNVIEIIRGLIRNV